MSNDTLLIEAYLEQKLDEKEMRVFAERRLKDREFAAKIWSQAMVHLAALIYGRKKRRSQIKAAADNAYSNPQFRNQIKAIFQ